LTLYSIVSLPSNLNSYHIKVYYLLKFFFLWRNLMKICSEQYKAFQMFNDILSYSPSLPNSSIISIEFWLADYIIQLVFSISSMNVEKPFNCASEAPALVIMASVIGNVAYSHETKLQIHSIKLVQRVIFFNCFPDYLILLPHPLITLKDRSVSLSSIIWISIPIQPQTFPEIVWSFT